ncbi:MAG: 16S rRNA (adenine(1518)-N(6)/adenine(1519)-N(6))-dimethyltransferase RsmA [Parcubacteria group bacterium]
MRSNGTSHQLQGFRPNKRLGQNFLTDKNILHKITGAADLKSTDNVLEVGPGKGVLTFEIAPRVKKLVTVEKDRRLIDELNSKLETLNPKQIQNPKLRIENCELKIINADILEVEEKELRQEFHDEPYKIVANLPYQITSHFLRKFLESEYRPTEMIIMVQKEVAERIVEKRGNMSMLSVSVQFFCEPKILFSVSRGCFSPAPRVDSAVIRLANIKQTNLALEPERFFSAVRRGFRFKRKLLKSNLGVSAEFLKSVGVSENARAQELSVEDWVKIGEKLEIGK